MKIFWPGTYTHSGELCIIFFTTLVERGLNAALLGACSTEKMQDYPLHVLEKLSWSASEGDFAVTASFRRSEKDELQSKRGP
jgi:hypothetical protein